MHPPVPATLRACAATVAACVALGATSAAGEGVRSQTAVAAIAELAPAVDAVAAELVLSESLRADVIAREDLQLTLIVGGRLGIRLLDEDPRIDRARVRALGLHVVRGPWRVDLGRFAVHGGGWRLVDGAQALVGLGGGWLVGAWAGFAPQPFTTAPALRGGGGPVVQWSHAMGEVGLTGEIVGAPEGLDRLSAVLFGRVEPAPWFEARAHVDLQLAGAGRVAPSDVTVEARFRPVETLDLDLVYGAYSGIALLTGPGQDPSLTRFEARSRALQGELLVPGETLDTTVTHLAGVSARWSPAFGPHRVARARLDVDGRWRHHASPERRFGRASAGLTLAALAGGRLDVGASGQFLWWGDRPGAEGAVQVFTQPSLDVSVALDASFRAGFKPLADTGVWAPTWYADAYVDWLGPKGLSVSLGYGLIRGLASDRAETYHALFAAVALRTRSRPTREVRWTP